MWTVVFVLILLFNTFEEKTKKAVCGRFGAFGSFFRFLVFFTTLVPGGGT
jgi:hypothetical protein